jgi:hypothetical protein
MNDYFFILDAYFEEELDFMVTVIPQSCVYLYSLLFPCVRESRVRFLVGLQIKRTANS